MSCLLEVCVPIHWTKDCVGYLLDPCVLDGGLYSVLGIDVGECVCYFHEFGGFVIGGL